MRVRQTNFVNELNLNNLKFAWEFIPRNIRVTLDFRNVVFSFLKQISIIDENEMI